MQSLQASQNAPSSGGMRRPPLRHAGPNIALRLGVVPPTPSFPSSSSSSASVTSPLQVPTGWQGLKILRINHPLEAVDDWRMSQSQTLAPNTPVHGSYHSQEIKAKIQEEVHDADAFLKNDTTAQRLNYRYALSLVVETSCMAGVIKADGYGAGLMNEAKLRRSEGCRDFFVARFSEAKQLRQGFSQRQNSSMAVFVLDGLVGHRSADQLIDFRITPVLNSLDQVKAWNDAGKRHSTKLPALLQFDTGMTRSGLDEVEVDQLFHVSDGEPGPNVPDDLSHINVLFAMTHLASGGWQPVTRPGTPEPAPQTFSAIPDDMAIRPNDASLKQLHRLNETIDRMKQFPGLADVKKTVSASNGVFMGEAFQADMVRVGGLTHGMAPFDADSNPLLPVYEYSTIISQVRTITGPADIGYGGNYHIPAGDTRRIATLPVGYADGGPRIAGGNREGDPPIKSYVTVHLKSGERRRAYLVGATSMDQTTVDVTNLTEGDLKDIKKVTFVDSNTTLDHFGAQTGTNAAEFLTKSHHRVAMVPRASEPKAPVLGAVASASPYAWAAKRLESGAQAHASRLVRPSSRLAPPQTLARPNSLLDLQEDALSDYAAGESGSS